MTTSIETVERKTLLAFDRALGIIRDATVRKAVPGERGSGQSGSIAMAQTFLTVCMSEGLSLTQIAENSGQPVSTASRHMLDLGPRDRHREPGFMLVDQRDDPADSRRKLYTLSARGKALKSRILKAMEV